jgi:hypothetical protein
MLLRKGTVTIRLGHGCGDGNSRRDCRRYSKKELSFAIFYTMGVVFLCYRPPYINNVPSFTPNQFDKLLAESERRNRAVAALVFFSGALIAIGLAFFGHLSTLGSHIDVVFIGVVIGATVLLVLYPRIWLLGHGSRNGFNNRPESMVAFI